MPRPIRCYMYGADGEPLRRKKGGVGCAFVRCAFTHPSDPGWSTAAVPASFPMGVVGEDVHKIIHHGRSPSPPSRSKRPRSMSRSRSPHPSRSRRRAKRKDRRTERASRSPSPRSQRETRRSRSRSYSPRHSRRRNGSRSPYYRGRSNTPTRRSARTSHRRSSRSFSPAGRSKAQKQSRRSSRSPSISSCASSTRNAGKTEQRSENGGVAYGPRPPPLDNRATNSILSPSSSSSGLSTLSQESVTSPLSSQSSIAQTSTRDPEVVAPGLSPAFSSFSKRPGPPDDVLPDAMSKLKVSSPNSETPITALIHEALDAQEPHTFPSHPHPHPPPPGPFPPPPEQRTDREPRREQENRVDEQPQTTPKAPPTTLPTTSESLSSQNNTKDARSTAPTSHHWIQSPVLARRADIESDTETVMPDKLDEGVPNEWTTRLRLLSRYVQAQDELQAVERDTQIYELAHSSLPQPVPLVSAELQKARTEKIQALHSAVKDFAQSGLWHLAAQDPSPRAGLQLDQKFEELKALMEVLSATTRGLYAQVSGEKFPAIPPPPSFPSSGSLSSMDIESGPDDDAPRGKKRRRISREESVSTNDEDDIERALLQDEESLQERVGGLEARLLETENLLHEWQWDLSQDLNDKLTKYVDKFRASSKKESEQFTSVVTRDREEIEKIKAELTSMNADVRELAEEVADHIRVSTSVKNENALLQVELGKTIEMIAVMAHSQKEQNTKAQEEIQALTAEVERLKAREVPPQPSSPAIMLTPEVLQQLGQLLQGSEVLPGLQQRIRDEIIQPTMAEHLTQVTKIMQEQQKETATNIISKVDKTSDMIAAIARWADSIKRDVDPGLLMSPSSTT